MTSLYLYNIWYFTIYLLWFFFFKTFNIALARSCEQTLIGSLHGRPMVGRRKFINTLRPRQTSRHYKLIFKVNRNEVLLQWRYNERNGVSNHKPRDCLLNGLFRSRSKHYSSASLAFVRGIHRWPVNSPNKGPETRKMFPFDEVIKHFLTNGVPVYWHKHVSLSCQHDTASMKVKWFIKHHNYLGQLISKKYVPTKHQQYSCIIKTTTEMSHIVANHIIVIDHSLQVNLIICNYYFFSIPYIEWHYNRVIWVILSCVTYNLPGNIKCYIDWS